MKELIKKIANAKAEIKNSPLKKEGRNEFSKYDYFTPSQIELLVSSACHNNGLMTTFDLIRNDLGVYGKLTVYDIESGNSMHTEMATAIPEIKATNIAQQLGGCVTYTERYLKMSFFGITDNKLDFDTTENTEKQSKQEQPKNADKGTKLAVKVDNAIEEVNNTKTVDELTEIWKKYVQFQSNESFIDCVKLQKKLLTK